MKRLTFLFVFTVLLLILSASSIAESDELNLTDSEKNFIKEHPVIYLGVDPNFVPFEFIDSDGVYKGIASDYIKLLSKKIGIEMVVKKDLTWDQAYELAVEKKIDVLPCVSGTEERKQYFIFSQPYYYFQRVIVVNESNKTIKGIEDLFNTRVAVQANSSHNSYLKSFQGIELSLYTTVKSALAAVSNGTETAFVGNLATSSYLIKANGFTSLKFIKLNSGDNQGQELQFAVRNDWPELVSIINKGLASITEEEKMEINDKWIDIGNEIDYGPILRVAAVIGSVILIILLVSIYWIVQLKKEVAKRIKIEEDLRAAKEEAEIANNFKSIFLARMSHEIRTPLNAITGMAYLIKKTNITLTQKLYLEKINQASHNMLSIINDILDFSKIEAGKVDIERVPFNLDKVLQQVVSIISFKIEEQKIGFNLSKDPKIPGNFMGDPKRLEQILLNIINNAVKFTNTGEVSLKIRIAERKDSLYKLEFIIKDSGIGMSNEQIEQLFKPFTQGDSSITRRFGGTGLGLSIVKSLIDMMGGEISVVSVLGEGSTFTILLSYEIDEDKELEDKRKIASTYIQDIKAIVLDNSVSSLHIIEGYLKYFGIDAEYTTSQIQALELLGDNDSYEGNSYNLLIFDYDTPKEGGLEFASIIKNNPLILKKPKLIMMIPLMRDDLFDKIENCDIEMGITKPLIPSVLFNSILEIFKVKALKSQLANELAAVNESRKLVKSYHALVVDDNKTNQFIAKSILEQVGFKVSLAENGLDGVEHYKNHQEEIDLILMDLHMPILSGYQAAIRIRKFDENIPIIAMTADAVSDVEDACKMVGINYYVSKPFDPDKLIETIINILENENENLQRGQKENIQSYSQIDKGILDEADGLRRLGNNQELYKMILEEFLNESKDVETKLKKAIDDKNYSEAVQIVHKIKGGSGNIGAKNLQTVASELQKALQNNNQSEVEKLQVEFNNMLRGLLKEIEYKLNK